MDDITSGTTRCVRCVLRAEGLNDQQVETRLLEIRHQREAQSVTQVAAHPAAPGHPIRVALKDTKTAYILWALGFCGICGLHRFYVGKGGSGLVYLVTLGWFFIGQFIDAALIPQMVREANTPALFWGAVAVANSNTNQNSLVVNVNVPGATVSTSSAEPHR